MGYIAIVTDTEIFVFVDGEQETFKEIEWGLNENFGSQCFDWDCSEGLGSDADLIEYQCTQAPGCNCQEF